MLLVPVGVFQQGLGRVKARHPEVQGWPDFSQKVYFRAIDLLAQSGGRGVVSPEEVEAIGETEWAMWPGRLGSLEEEQVLDESLIQVYLTETQRWISEVVEMDSYFLKLLKDDLRKQSL